MIYVVSCSYLPEEQEVIANEVLVEETGDYILISADGSVPEKALLFVPGGFVDPHVYLCWMTELVVLYPKIAVLQLKVPSNLAISNSGKIKDVMKQFEGIEHWVIGGHSLGGVVAVFAVCDDPAKFEGLLLMASWATESKSLREWDGKALSLAGSNDGLATVEEINANKDFLPEGSRFVLSDSLQSTPGTTYYYIIEGGNHSGFGCYGFQDGDMEAGISKDQQQGEMLNAMIKYFDLLWD